MRCHCDEQTTNEHRPYNQANGHTQKKLFSNQLTWDEAASTSDDGDEAGEETGLDAGRDVEESIG